MEKGVIEKYGLKSEPFDFNELTHGLEIHPTAIFIPEHCRERMEKRNIQLPDMGKRAVKIFLSTQFFGGGTVIDDKNTIGLLVGKGGYFIVRAFRNEKNGNTYLKALTVLKRRQVLNGANLFGGRHYSFYLTADMRHSNVVFVDSTTPKTFENEKVSFNSGGDAFFGKSYKDLFNDLMKHPSYSFKTIDNFVKLDEIPDDLMSVSKVSKEFGLGKGYSRVLDINGQPNVFV